MALGAGVIVSAACRPTETVFAAPQFPLTGLADDVARLRQCLDFQDCPAIVADSYVAKSDSPLADAPNVADLVSIAAFALIRVSRLGALSQDAVTPALSHLSRTSTASRGLSESRLRYLCRDVRIRSGKG